MSSADLGPGQSSGSSAMTFAQVNVLGLAFAPVIFSCSGQFVATVVRALVRALARLAMLPAVPPLQATVRALVPVLPVDGTV